MNLVSTVVVLGTKAIPKNIGLGILIPRGIQIWRHRATSCRRVVDSPKTPSFVKPGTSSVRLLFVVLSATLILGASVPAASPKRIVVYLVGGQSNANGMGAAAGLPPELAAPLTHVLFYHGISDVTLPTNTWISLQTGSGYTNGFGPELVCGHTLHQRVGSTGTQIALIKYAKGGTSLNTDWYPGGNASTTGDGPQYVIFQNIVASARAALAAQDPAAVITIEGMIWQHGERDAVIGTHTSYQASLTKFVADIRATYGSTLPFVIGQLSSGQTSLNPARVQVIKTAQAAVAAADSRNGLIVTDDLPIRSDALHFETAGQLALGERFATLLLNLPITASDGNGLAAAWEVAGWGLGATGQDPEDDPDIDGRSNLEEFLWNTDPHVSDGPRPVVSGPVGGGLTLSWNVRPSRRYLIETSPDLENWTRVGSFMPSDPSRTNTATFDATGTRAFYRIGVQR